MVVARLDGPPATHQEVQTLITTRRFSPCRRKSLPTGISGLPYVVLPNGAFVSLKRLHRKPKMEQELLEEKIVVPINVKSGATMDRTLGEHVQALEEKIELGQRTDNARERFKQTQPPGIKIADCELWSRRSITIAQLQN